MSAVGIKGLIREPALLIDLAETVVIALVAFGFALSGDQQNYIVAAVVAALGLAKAFLTRPFAVAALTDFGRAALVLLASFGVGLTADQIAVLVTLLGTVTTVVIRAQITPNNSPVVVRGGSGAGPVAGYDHERGAVALLPLAVVLLVIGVLLMSLTAYQTVGVALLIAAAVVVVLALITDGSRLR